jgi:hypothetical protein
MTDKLKLENVCIYIYVCVYIYMYTQKLENVCIYIYIHTFSNFNLYIYYMNILLYCIVY